MYVVYGRGPFSIITKLQAILFSLHSIFFFRKIENSRVMAPKIEFLLLYMEGGREGGSPVNDIKVLSGEWRTF